MALSSVASWRTGPPDGERSSKPAAVWTGAVCIDIGNSDQPRSCFTWRGAFTAVSCPPGFTESRGHTSCRVFPYLGVLSGTSPESCAASALRPPGNLDQRSYVWEIKTWSRWWIDDACSGTGVVASGRVGNRLRRCCWLALSLPTFDPTPPVEPVAFTLVAPRGALSVGATLWPHLQSHARRCGEPPAGGFRPSWSHRRSYGTRRTTRPPLVRGSRKYRYRDSKRDDPMAQSLS